MAEIFAAAHRPGSAAAPAHVPHHNHAIAAAVTALAPKVANAVLLALPIPVPAQIAAAAPARVTVMVPVILIPLANAKAAPALAAPASPARKCVSQMTRVAVAPPSGGPALAPQNAKAMNATHHHAAAVGLKPEPAPVRHQMIAPAVAARASVTAPPAAKTSAPLTSARCQSAAVTSLSTKVLHQMPSAIALYHKIAQTTAPLAASAAAPPAATISVPLMSARCLSAAVMSISTKVPPTPSALALHHKIVQTIVMTTVAFAEGRTVTVFIMASVKMSVITISKP